MSYIKNIFIQAKEWIAEYPKQFYEDDADVMYGIRLKEIHTGYVTENCRELAMHLELNEHDVELCELIGLLHDVGRFEQWKVYRTFRDNLSEDHADLGVKVFKKLPFYAMLNEEDRELLLFAIQNHNKKAISTAPSDKHLLMAKIIRDADKLDIYRANLEKVCAPPGAGYSNVPKQGFIAGNQISAGDLKTSDDLKLIYLLWVYDIYYTWTLKKIWERGFLQKITSTLPVDKDMDVPLIRILETVKTRIKENMRENNI